jgi:hypothetical protein
MSDDYQEEDCLDEYLHALNLACFSLPSESPVHFVENEEDPLDEYLSTPDIDFLSSPNESPARFVEDLEDPDSHSTDNELTTSSTAGDTAAPVIWCPQPRRPYR